MKAIDLVLFDLKEWACPEFDPANCMSPEELSKVEITEIAENDFRVEYDKYNPYEGFLYYIRIRETETTYEFETYRTAYGDTGIMIRDKNLKPLYLLDIDTREIMRDFTRENR